MFEATDSQKRKALSVKRIRGRRPEVELRCDDPTITPSAGLLLVGELDDRLGIAETIQKHVGRIKQRRQGVESGEIVLAMAESMLAGGDFLCDLDDLRADVAGAELRAVEQTPASTTVNGLARRFDGGRVAGIESAIHELITVVFALLPRSRRRALRRQRPTIDLDPTDVEVYGTQKEGVAFNYQGQRAGRPHLAVWAEAGWGLAADLTSAREDPRPRAPSLIARAIAALPRGMRRPRIRCDAGLFSREVADAAVANGADFAIAAKRNPAVWRTVRFIPENAWRKADGMPGAEVAVADYVPHGWPEGTRSVVRRVRITGEAISTDPRTRRRRTIDPEELRMVFGGRADHAYAYSIICTNLQDDPVQIEAWFRERAQIEERIRDTKLGMALRHLPSGCQSVNTVWMWAALLALNISAWLQALTGLDHDGRAHGKRLRRELIRIPARFVRHRRRPILRLHPTYQNGPFTAAYAALRALPVPGG